MNREPKSVREADMVTTVRVLWEEQAGYCWYCRKPVPSREATKDHVVAQAHGGTNEKSNLVVAHQRCNAAKGSRRTHRVKTIGRLNALRALAGAEPLRAEDVELPEITLLDEEP